MLFSQILLPLDNKDSFDLTSVKIFSILRYSFVRYNFYLLIYHTFKINSLSYFTEAEKKIF